MNKQQRAAWETAIKPVFPSDATIDVNPNSDDFEAKIWWPLPTAERPHRHSRAIRLVIAQEAIEAHFEKEDVARRAQDKESAREWIRDMLQTFDPDHQAARGHPPPEVNWVIDTSVLDN